MTESIKSDILTLRESSKIAYVSSINEAGYPLIKAMLVLEHDSLKTQFFSTNLSSKRAQQFLKNPRASVYYCDDDNFKGLLFTGNMEVCTDRESKIFLWREGFEIYYPKGIDDEDYCVLKFIAETGNYYHGLKNINFGIEELKD